jgi:hypothetical protein
MAVSLLLSLALAAADPSVAAARTVSHDVAEKSADAGDKMICKKFLETGSLVKGTRICKTKSEWQHSRDDVRTGMSMSGQMSCASGNGGACFQ